MLFVLNNEMSFLIFDATDLDDYSAPKFKLHFELNFLFFQATEKSGPKKFKSSLAIKSKLPRWFGCGLSEVSETDPNDIRKSIVSFLLDHAIFTFL